MEMQWGKRFSTVNMAKGLAVQLALLAAGLCPCGVRAELAVMATGEYSPFVSQHLQDFGVTAAIVSAAFKTQGVDVKYEFLPWKRGYNDALLGKHVGTFPYLKTPEREAEFFYSEAFFTDHFRLFVRRAQQGQRDWANKRVCIPLGYDTTQIQFFTDANQITLERPSDIGNCFQMLERERVDAVWVSELVAIDTVRALFGATAKTYPLDMSLVDEVQYYFIVSKTLPHGSHWMARFDAGLKHIRKNGTYKKILRRFGSS